MADRAIPLTPNPTDAGDIPAFVSVVNDSTKSLPDRAADVATLLQSLDEAAAQAGQSATACRADHHETKLVHARLGIASGLHAALRCKDPATASHSVRVALGCSSWAASMSLEPELRDAIEVAALLHHVGKIGVPDKILAKPANLLHAQAEAMRRP